MNILDPKPENLDTKPWRTKTVEFQVSPDEEGDTTNHIIYDFHDNRDNELVVRIYGVHRGEKVWLLDAKNEWIATMWVETYIKWVQEAK
jgi:hypothetical protein